MVENDFDYYPRFYCGLELRFFYNVNIKFLDVLNLFIFYC